MLDIAKKLQEHIENRLRHMTEITLNDIRKLEYVHDSQAQRCFLSGKLAAYEEMLLLVLDQIKTGP